MHSDFIYLCIYMYVFWNEFSILVKNFHQLCFLFRKNKQFVKKHLYIASEMRYTARVLV